MKTKILIIAITLAICTASAAAEAAQTPFMISGYVFYEDGSACHDPEITITNLNTSRTFPTLTLPSSNYYRADPTPSSDEVSKDNLLQFTVGTGLATLDHRVNASDLAFGLFLNLTVGVDGGSVTAVVGSGAGGASIAIPAGTPEPSVTPPAQEPAELQEAQTQTPRSPQESEQASQEPGPAYPGWERKVPGFGVMSGAAGMGLAAVVCLVFRRRTG